MALPREVLEKVVFYRSEVDRIFREYLRPGRTGALAAVPAPVDVYEGEHAVSIDVELPGVAAGEIELSYSRDVLLIEGTRSEPSLDALPGGRFFHAERSYGRFQRMVELPRAADMGRVSARLEEGVLRIVIPKLTDRRGRWRRIPISETPAPVKAAVPAGEGGEGAAR
jgi:HSP20 family protein